MGIIFTTINIMDKAPFVKQNLPVLPKNRVGLKKRIDKGRHC